MASHLYAMADVVAIGLYWQMLCQTCWIQQMICQCLADVTPLWHMLWPLSNVKKVWQKENKCGRCYGQLIMLAKWSRWNATVVDVIVTELTGIVLCGWCAKWGRWNGKMWQRGWPMVAIPYATISTTHIVNIIKSHNICHSGSTSARL